MIIASNGEQVKMGKTWKLTKIKPLNLYLNIYENVLIFKAKEPCLKSLEHKTFSKSGSFDLMLSYC